MIAEKNIIGKIVNVTMDRPIGTAHPKHPDMIYPVNYGYIDGLIAPDGEEQDVYVLGVSVPLEAFKGVVIAVVHRLDDIEDKWVAAPEGMTFSAEEIKTQIAFQEKYYTSIVDTLEGKCDWCRDGGAMEAYHDREWGLPLHDDRKQFEFLMLEAMQCGLSWALMIKKRDIFRACFDNFDYSLIARYGDDKIESIMETPGMIRSERKIRAIINNARCFMKIAEEFGSFDAYIWGFTHGKTICYRGHENGDFPAKNELSDLISDDLRKRGFKYLGSITVYSHLQACGIINDHVKDCYLYEYIKNNFPCEEKEK